MGYRATAVKTLSQWLSPVSIKMNRGGGNAVAVLTDDSIAISKSLPAAALVIKRFGIRRGNGSALAPIMARSVNDLSGRQIAQCQDNIILTESDGEYPLAVSAVTKWLARVALMSRQEDEADAPST